MAQTVLNGISVKGNVDINGTIVITSSLVLQNVTIAPGLITQDANNRFVTDAEKTAWNAKSDFNGMMSAVVINTDKDWNAKSITNMNGLTAVSVNATTETVRSTTKQANYRLEYNDTEDSLDIIWSG